MTERRCASAAGRWTFSSRWLKAPVKEEDGQLVPREKGTPQGGVISPLLANLFLHYAFDRWMSETYPQNPFERFADDGAPRAQRAEEGPMCVTA